MKDLFEFIKKTVFLDIAVIIDLILLWTLDTTVLTIFFIIIITSICFIISNRINKSKKD